MTGKIMKLEIGDIIGHKGKGWLAFLVKIGAKQEHSHVMVYLGNNQIIEAAPGGIEIRHFNIDHVENPNRWTVSRTKIPLTKEQQNKIVRKAYEFSAESHKYAFYQGPMAFLYKWFRDWDLLRNLIVIIGSIDERKFMHCAELGSRLFFEGIEIDLSPEHHALTLPDDITYLNSPKLMRIQWKFLKKS